MVQEIFLVENEEVILNPNILLIPEYKQLWDAYRNLQWFSHIHFTYHPESPYNNSAWSEDEKAEKIRQAFPDADPEDPIYCIARDEFEQHVVTPSKVIYESLKIGAQKIATYVRTTQVTGGRDGDFTQIRQHVKEGDVMMKAATKTENAYKEELQSARGGEETTSDENMDYT